MNARVALMCVVVAFLVPSVDCGSASAADRPVRNVDRIHATRRWRHNRVVYFAWRATSIPYRWGGASLRTGFDCSGLVKWAYAQIGIRLPHYSYAQWRYGRRIRRSQLHPGDAVFFSHLAHVGIYIGAGRLIHAPHPGTRPGRAAIRLARLELRRRTAADRRLALCEGDP